MVSRDLNLHFSNDEKNFLKHFFMYLFAICISSAVKCPNLLCIFLLVYGLSVFLLLSFERSLYIYMLGTCPSDT